MKELNEKMVCVFLSLSSDEWDFHDGIKDQLFQHYGQHAFLVDNEKLDCFSKNKKK